MLKKSVIIMTIAVFLFGYMLLPANTLAADAYETAAEEVAPFKAGDTVTAKITISKININKLAGVDLVASYDNTLLEPVNLNGKSVKDWNASKGALDEAGETDWDFSGRVEAGESRVYMYFTEENTKGMNEAGKLWVEMSFKALKDGNPGDTVVTIVSATGADIETAGLVTGLGCAAKVGEGTNAPTEEPTEEPTGEPGGETTQPTPPIPEGDAFDVTANDVYEFKTGDTMKIKFTATDFDAQKAVKSVRLGIAYSAATIRAEASESGGRAEVPDSEWTVSGELDDGNASEYIMFVTFAKNGDPAGLTRDDRLGIELNFTALKDGNTNDIIAYIHTAEATLEDDTIIDGKGTVVIVKVTPATPEPTEEPTPEPTDAPTEAPTTPPDETTPTRPPVTPVVPDTADLGVLPLAAVALSFLSIIKKKIR